MKKSGFFRRMHRIRIYFMMSILCGMVLCTIKHSVASDNFEFSARNNNSISVNVSNKLPNLVDLGSNVSIKMQGYQSFMSPGNPILPYKVFWIALPPHVDIASIKVTLSDVTRKTINVQKLVMPSPPIVAWDGTRTIYSWGEGKDIEDGYNKNIYGVDSFYPSSTLSILGTSQLRKWRCCQILFFPVHYNPVRGSLSIIQNAQIVISYKLLAPVLAMSPYDTANTSMDVEAASLIDNYEQATSWYATNQGPMAPSENTLSYVIITTESIKNGSTKLAAFEQFKESQGFNVLTVTESNQYDDVNSAPTGSGWGGGSGDAAANNIRNWLIANDPLLGGIDYVLLIGDPTPSDGDVPMKMCWPEAYDYKYHIMYHECPTDYFYADLTGNWDLDNDGRFGEFPDDIGTGGVDTEFPEIYVGRIPVYGNGYSQLDSILEKTISYGTASTSQDWRKKILLPMKPSEPGITDGYPLGEGIRTYALNKNESWSCFRIYEQNYNYFPELTPCNPTNVENEWKKKYGLVTWWTHGDATTAISVFETSQCDKLDNAHPSFVFQCSCWNGCPEITDNLGYSLLVNGAIATVSASRVSWYLQGNSNWNSGGTNSHLAYEYSKKIIDGFRCGKALYDVKMAISKSYLDASWWYMNLLDFNLYGDPAIGIADNNSNENHAPVLSNPRVSPTSGTTSTNFEFMVDYYDADGDSPDLQYRQLHLSNGQTYTMTLKSGSASNGTYHYTTTLPIGSYSYYFLFADTHQNAATTPWQNGPSVHTTNSIAELKVEVSGGPVSNNIEIEFGHGADSQTWLAPQLPQTVEISSGESLMFSVSTKSDNHDFIKWVFRDDDGNIVRESTSSGYGFTLSSGNIHATAYFDYTPHDYVIAGTVLREDGTPVPDGVTVTLSSSEQQISQTTMDGNFTFTGIRGGIPVSVSFAASKYAFTPANLNYVNLHLDHTEENVVAYSSDCYAPTTTFVTIPPTVSENSSVSFSWIGSDDVSVPGALLYQYKLDGVDADWSDWTYSTSKSYTLANGVYTFWVRAKDEKGNINQAPSNYTFAVNAAPKVLSVKRINQSVWASRVTLKMPEGASGFGNSFVLLPEYSGTSDSELIPVAIHRAGEVTPCGANEIVAEELGLPPRIIKADMGYLVILPDSLSAGEEVKYDIVWGKIKYFGWQEHIDVANGFPDAITGNGYVTHIEGTYLDDNLRMWRMAAKRRNRVNGVWGSTAEWVFMGVADGHGIIRDAVPLLYQPGTPDTGTYAVDYGCNGGGMFPLGSNMCLVWQDEKYEKVGPSGSYEDHIYHRYCFRLYDHSINPVSSYDSDWQEDTSICLPRSAVHNGLYFTGRTYYTGSGAELWFILHDYDGYLKKGRTVFASTRGTNSHDMDLYYDCVKSLGGHIVFLFRETWQTVEGDDRKEVKYQVRDVNGSLITASTALNPALLPDTVEEDDSYDFTSALTDNEGKVWVTFERRTAGSRQYYYSIIGTDGNVWKGPILVTGKRIFNFCDKDGYIWATENGQIIVLNSDDTLAFPARQGVYIPNQDVDLIAADVNSSGYRLYDRWSAQVVKINVPSGVKPHSMKVFDLNMWDNNLHPANLNIRQGDNSIYSQSGQFTGHVDVNVENVLAAGDNILTITQDDVFGGQILLTFPYVFPTLEVTPSERRVGYQEGSTTFSVSNTGTGDMNWTAEVIQGDSWLRITSGASGTNDGTITVHYTENTDIEHNKTGKIKVTAEGAEPSEVTVSVIQSSPHPKLKVEPDNRNVGCHAGTTSFTVSNEGTGDMEWTAEVIEGGDWLSITSGDSGTNDGTIAVAFGENTSTETKIGRIRVTAGDGVEGSPKEVTIIQAPCNYYTLTVHIRGQGQVQLQPPGGSYRDGTEVILTAIPDKDFDHWEGDDVNDTNKRLDQLSITMDRNKEVTAFFKHIVKGDLDNSGDVNVFDVILALRMLLEMPVTINGDTYTSPYPNWLKNGADMNDDDTLDISDIILMQRMVVGLN